MPSKPAPQKPARAPVTFLLIVLGVCFGLAGAGFLVGRYTLALL